MSDRATYNPSGVSRTPKPLRLLDGESAVVDQAVRDYGIRQSVLLREAHNAGMPIVLARLAATENHSSSPSAAMDGEPASGASSTGPASFSQA